MILEILILLGIKCENNHFFIPEKPGIENYNPEIFGTNKVSESRDRILSLQVT